MEAKYGNLYVGVSFKRDNLFLFAYPLFLTHRLIYVLIPSTIPLITFQLSLMFIFNLIYLSYKWHSKPNLQSQEKYLHRFNDIMFHIAFVYSFLFTDFVISNETRYDFSYPFVCLMMLVCLVNILFVLNEVFDNKRKELRWKALKIAKE